MLDHRYNHTVIARLSTGEWSAPSAIATIGCQYGFLAGADLTDYIVVLATDDAVRAFAGLGQFTVGGEIDVSPILECLMNSMPVNITHNYLIHNTDYYRPINIITNVIFAKHVQK